ncbi:uncharacterized protein BJ212DRAFT_399994 [Suillus subaureus]|uniref:Secreted protein n=1 Tax=Suillus subaureus TaxID=48587 RepID=A0A9P7E7G8_9AGAM|nr:uncharacterized protein BJ212DRAFT_399994 [Suillus subaureus]KAG1813597.1 hypothetical protein BJ212DRAFT_399994 [Suillus subaureus]
MWCIALFLVLSCRLFSIGLRLVGYVGTPRSGTVIEPQKCHRPLANCNRILVDVRPRASTIYWEIAQPRLMSRISQYLTNRKWPIDTIL